MKRTLLGVALFAALSASSEAQAIELADNIRAAGHWGIGLGGGLSTSGVSFKWFMADYLALEAVAGFFGGGGAFGSDNLNSGGLGLQADLLFELPTIVMAGDVMELGWAIGPGVWTSIGGTFWLGVNGTLALEFNFIPVPIDLVLEYKPSLLLIDNIDFSAYSFAGHVRIYFM